MSDEELLNRWPHLRRRGSGAINQIADTFEEQIAFAKRGRSRRSDMSRTICLDFDGVLHQYVSPWTSATEVLDGPTEGAQEFCRTLIDAGYDLTIYSVRTWLRGGRDAIAQWLIRNDFPKGIQIAEGEKPVAICYIDDHAYRFNGNFMDALTFITSGEMRPWNWSKKK